MGSPSHVSIPLQPPSHAVCVHGHDTRCLSQLCLCSLCLTTCTNRKILISVLHSRFSPSSSLSNKQKVTSIVSWHVAQACAQMRDCAFKCKRKRRIKCNCTEFESTENTSANAAFALARAQACIFYCGHDLDEYTVEPVLGDLWFGRPLILGDHNHWHDHF